MSKRTEAYREIGIINAYDFAGKGVFIDYQPGCSGRWHVSKAWKCCRLGYQTDPKAHWADHGNKTVIIFGAKGATLKEKRASALKDIMGWASKKYGIKHWAKTPYGSYMEANFIKERIAELDEMVEAKKRGEI